ncbi:MAG TPA: hypothetical protein VN704_02465 [Verrucomicrobiae bacterium]|nr:hypothetical protein [Verrucomicrobiae bacterium]
MYGHTLQTYLVALLSFEPSRPLPVPMTRMYHQVLVVIGPFSSSYKSTEFDEGVLYLSC